MLSNVNGIFSSFTSDSAERQNTLSQATSNCTLTTLKATLARSTLTQEQIKAIYTARGLHGAQLSEAVASTMQARAAKSYSLTQFVLTASTKGLTVAMKELGAALIANPFTMFITVLGVAAAGIYAVNKAINYSAAVLKKAEEKAWEASNTYQEAKTNLEQLNSEIQTTNQRIDELNQKENKSFVEKDELEKLIKNNAELERKLVLEEALASAAKEEARTTAIDYINTDSKYGKFTGSYAVSESVTGNQLDITKQRITDYEILLDKQSELQKKADSFKINKPDSYQTDFDYTSILNELDLVNTRLKDLAPSITGSIEKFKEFEDSLDPEKDRELLASIGEISDAFIKLVSPESFRKIKFDEMWNSDDFKQAKEDLIELSEAGKLDDKILSTNEKYKRLLEKTGATAKEVASHINNMYYQGPPDFPDISIDDTLAVYDNAAKKLTLLKDLQSALGESYTLTAEEARKFIEIYPEFLSSAEVTADGIMEFNRQSTDDFIACKEVEINADKQVKIAQLENLKAAITSKMELAKAELAILEAMGNSEIDAENQKNTALAEAKDNLVQHLVDLGMEETNADAAAKEIMAGNMQEYDRITADVSSNIDSNLSKSISGAAINVNKQSGSMIDNLYSIGKQAVKTGKSILSIGTDSIIDITKEGLSGVVGLFQNFDYSNIDGNFVKQIAKPLDILKYKITELKVNIKRDEIDKYEEALDNINAQVNILNSNSLIDTNINQRPGSDHRGNSNDKTFEGTYDKSAQSIKVLEKELNSYTAKLDHSNLSSSEQLHLLDQIIEKHTALVDAYKKSALAAQDRWDTMKDTLGEEQLALIVSGNEFGIENFSGREEEYKRLKEASEIYIDMLDKQQKYSDQSLSLEKRRIEKYNKLQEKLDNDLSLASNRKADAQNDIDRLENREQIVSADHYAALIRYSQQEIQLYEQKIQLAEQALKLEAIGTPRYYELKNAIQSCKNSIASCRQEQDDYNQAILEIPIRVLEKENEELDRQIAKLQKQKELLDSSISGATGILEDRKKELEENKQATDSYYNGLIDNLNKEKDAIDEQIDSLKNKNDEINRSLETEKKRAALEAAKTQRTKRVLKNGVFVWEADQDAIQNAQKDLNDQLLDNEVSSLEDKKTRIDDNISGLENKRDQEIEKIDKQIEALEEYLEKWQEISSAFEKEKNSAILAAQLGLSLDEVKKQLLAGNLDLLKNISQSYQKVSVDMDVLNTTKEKNEELILTFEQYVRDWQDGVISIGEAKTAIQEIVGDNEIELEAMTNRINSTYGYRDSWSESYESIAENLGLLQEAEALSAEEEAASLALRSQSLSAFAISFNETLSSIVDHANVQLSSLANAISEKADTIQARCEDICQAVREALAAEKKLNGEKERSSHSQKSLGGPGGPNAVKKHDGIKSGLIGNTPTSASEQEKALKELSLNKLNPDEVLTKLKYKEAVLTPEQIQTLLNNFSIAASIPAAGIPISAAAPNKKETRIDVKFGDINITEAQNITDIERGILDGTLKMGLTRQAYSRVKEL